jgi:MFS family permease
VTEAVAGAQPGPLAPLRERNYRLVFAGNLTSNLGTFCQTIAQSLLVYKLTKSTFLVGVVNFAQFAAVPIFAPAAGAVADRMDRRRILVVAQLGSFAASALLTALSVAGKANAAMVIALAGLLGVASAFAFPVSRAFAPLLVSEPNLGRAINLDSVSVNVARAVGPIGGALIVGQAGVTWAFGINALSYLVLVVALLRVEPRAQAGSIGRSRFRDGLMIVWRRPMLAALLFVIAACAIGADPPSTLGPELAHHFGGGDTMAGLILGAFGVGGVTGAFVAGAESLRHHRKVGRLLVVLVAGLAIFAVAAHIALVLVGTFLAGFGYLTAQTRTSTLLVRSTADHERGRVMGLWSIAFIGTRPVASLIDGAVGSAVNVRLAALLMAVPAAVACGLCFAIDRRSLGAGAGAGAAGRT